MWVIWWMSKPALPCAKYVHSVFAGRFNKFLFGHSVVYRNQKMQTRIDARNGYTVTELGHKFFEEYIMAVPQGCCSSAYVGIHFSSVNKAGECFLFEQ